eukprot:10267904-Ditylum_brightwellii.AAC.1
MYQQQPMPVRQMFPMQQQQMFPMPQQQPFYMQQQQPTLFQQQANLFQQHMTNGTNPYLQKYCWSYGGANHTRTDCKTPADGHQLHATFHNRLGGNTRNCFI